jgi:hypothetical protein
LLFEVGIEVIEAVEGGNGHEEVAPSVAYKPFDLPLVVPFGRATETVLEQIVGLQLAKGPSALSTTVTEDTGYDDRSVVVHNALGHSTEEGEGSIVTVAEGLCGLCWISLHEAPIAVG